jgi:transposase
VARIVTTIRTDWTPAHEQFSPHRQTGFLMPPRVDEWLPQRHLARFVVEVVDDLDLRAMSGAYRGSGSASYHPAVLLSLLVYGYATGMFSSRKLEPATYDSVAFRFIAANDHPDHDAIATFRRRFLKEIEALFVEVLKLARSPARHRRSGVDPKRL